MNEIEQNYITTPLLSTRHVGKKLTNPNLTHD